jgi:hypothetical protein
MCSSDMKILTDSLGGRFSLISIPEPSLDTSPTPLNEDDDKKIVRY